MSADEGRDNIDVERGSMVKIDLVDSLERVLIASIKTGGEFDGGVGAGPKVESGTLDLCRSSSVAGIFLGVAVSHVDSGKFFRVGCVCTVVILDGAGSLKSRSEVDKGVSVDSEWSVTGGGGDGWGCATESASESLFVG